MRPPAYAFVAVAVAVLAFCAGAAPALGQTQSTQSAAVVPVPQPMTQPPAYLDATQERDRRYEQRFIDIERSIAIAVQNLKENTSLQFAATKEAVTKAEVAAEKRFDSVNEFRNTLKDQQGKFISKDEVETRMTAMNDRLAELRQTVTNNTARSEGAMSLWVLISGVIGLLIGGVVAAVAVLRQAGSPKT